MKTIIITLLLFTLISCQFPNQINIKEKPKIHMHELRDKIKTCVLANSTSSETLKNAFKGNNDVSLIELFSKLKNTLEGSDKEILRECRKESFKALQGGRFEQFRHHGPREDRAKKSPEKSNKVRNLKEDNHKYDDIKTKIFTCIEESGNVTENLKKIANQYKDTKFKKFFFGIKEKLTKEEREVLKKCTKGSLNEMEIKKIKKLKKKLGKSGKKDGNEEKK